MTPRVCLIIPPSVFLLDERVFPSLGVLKVAAALERLKIPVEVSDLSGVPHYEVPAGFSWYGITATTPQLPHAIRIARLIRESQPDAVIVLGGPHATLVNASCKKSTRALAAKQQLTNAFDLVIAGDGELSLPYAIEHNLRGWLDADSPTSPLFVHKDELYPARHLIATQTYKYTIDGASATSIVTQLGCPFNCAFCGGRSSPSYRRVRVRSPLDVVTEVESLYRTYSYTGFMFYDDELNVNQGLISLCKQLRDLQTTLGVEFRLRGFIKSELLTDEQAVEMYAAGFRWVLVGFESGSSRVLQSMNKTASVADNDRCIEICHRAGLKVKALMSIGHAGESKSTIAETKQWLLRVKPDDFDVTTLTVYPGAPYYDQAQRVSDSVWMYTAPKTQDKLFSMDVDYTDVPVYYKGDPKQKQHAFAFTEYLSVNDLASARLELDRDLRIALGIPSPTPSFEHSMSQAADAAQL